MLHAKKSHVETHMWNFTSVKFHLWLTCHTWYFTCGNFTSEISRVKNMSLMNFTCVISHLINMSHVKFHTWNFACEKPMNFTFEISHVKFDMWNFKCEIPHVRNMSHGEHMGFGIHMCFWNFTCESNVYPMWNTCQFSETVEIFILKSKSLINITFEPIYNNIVWNGFRILVNNFGKNYVHKDNSAIQY